jgi:ribokinase
MKLKNILTVGSINVDLSINSNETPKFGMTVYGDLMISCGGKGVNQAIAAAKCSADVRFLGCVGNDAYADMTVENLKSNNVRTEEILHCDGNTGVAVITVSDGKNMIVIDKGANYKLLPEQINAKEYLFEWADYVVMQFEIPIESVVQSAVLAHKHNACVVLNPAPYMDIPEILTENTDIIIPNEFEAGLMVGFEIKSEKDAEKALKILMKKYKNVIITLGGKGCIYSDKNEIKRQLAFNVNAVDTTAAGDSFIGGFVYSMSRGNDLSNSVEFATAVSAITVSRRGASVSIPTYKEAEDFLKLKKEAVN